MRSGLICVAEVLAWAVTLAVCWFAWMQVSMVYRILYGG